MVWNSPSVVTSLGRRAERERGEQAHHQLVGVGRQRDAAARVAEQAGEPLPDLFGPGEGALPLLVHQLRRVEPRVGLGLEADVGPGLVRMAGEEQPVRHPEAPVVRREGIGRAGERGEVHYSSVRMAQRSGKSG